MCYTTYKCFGGEDLKKQAEAKRWQMPGSMTTALQVKAKQYRAQPSEKKQH